MTAARDDFPRLALPFTIILDGERVRLVHGEEVRYSLTLGRLAGSAAAILRRCSGEIPVRVLLAEIADEDRPAAEKLIARLFSERILAAGPAEAAHQPAAYSLAVEGSGPLAERLLAERLMAERLMGERGEPSLAILCQETLDYHTLLEFNRRQLRAGDRPWLWATTGPVGRGFVSPVILPGAGPCLACLWNHFRRLSPAEGIYDALVRHGAAGGAFSSAEFPAAGIEMLVQLVRWKCGELALPRPPLAIFRLHVLELETMEVSVHRVLADPTCQECRDAPLV